MVDAAFLSLRVRFLSTGSPREVRGSGIVPSDVSVGGSVWSDHSTNPWAFLILCPSIFRKTWRGRLAGARHPGRRGRVPWARSDPRPLGYGPAASPLIIIWRARPERDFLPGAPGG